MIMGALFALTKTQILLIFLPLLVVQFALAVFCLSKLAYCNVAVKQYVIWNVFIVLFVYVGAITFLIYYFTHREKLRQKDDPIINDVALDKKEESETESVAETLSSSNSSDNES